ncbi:MULTISPECIES: styrene monooxygenase/indole monooxygenase family protein [unclassified Acinetobacter]|uniref:styrene monooxygenase/indole monooxygenase family protein n=1 Tax=unclassified Acinetobacter TaxID=196816 RepID=UPI002578DB1C|nr:MULTISPECIES: styrene monooxygenase/indole monooxygenase family protein [unclassified Acinetobacter]MDM1758240.1 FAD-binding oxidoreductase [Acinetobacter sp. 256-1]MDM1760595.1 FAD-binding oxidoreductase [Acinetobacter sp. 251-1]
MRKIAIVGAGQAGLQLGLGLLDKGYEVSMYTNRTAEQVKHGKVMSSQCMFHNALQTERDLGLNQWEEQCPAVEGISVTLVEPEKKEKVFSWSARLQRYAQSVDQRVKMPEWMGEFERRGGKLVIQDVGLAELEQLAEQYELVLLAAGKGEIVNQFGRDDTRSPFQQPQRALALTYVKGMRPMSPYSRVAFNLIPNVGEYFCFPALTTSGPCEIMVFEGIPNGPMDCWQEVKTPEQHLAKSLEILEKYIPWEADRCQNVELTDDGGYIAGRFTPTVRHPVLTLASGKKVFGMADALVVNDPITGQGSNNAAKCCKVYYDAILAHADQAFDEAWMQQTFDRYWDYAQYVVDWTNSMLRPPEPQMIDALVAASQNQHIAVQIANNFDDPRGFSPWWFDAEASQQFLQGTDLNRVA